METLYNTQLDLLKEEYDTHGALLNVEKGMNRVLKTKDVAEISNFSTKCEQLNSMVANLEDKRLELCDEIKQKQ